MNGGVLGEVSALLRDRCPGRFRGRVTSVKGGLGRIAMMLGTAVGAPQTIARSDHI